MLGNESKFSFRLRTSQMKIIFLTDEIYPDYIGGAGFSTFILAKSLREAGHEILIISATDQAECDQQRRIVEGVEIFYIYARHPRVLRGARSLYNRQAVSMVEKIIKERRPEIIHVHNVSYFLSFYSVAVARKYVRALFFTARDTMSFTYGKFFWYIDRNNLNIQRDFNYRVKVPDLIRQAGKSYLPFRNYLIRKWLNRCDAIFAISDELKKALEQNGFNKVLTIYNSVSTDAYDAVSDRAIIDFKNRFALTDKKILFSAGRASELKGTFQLVAMMAIIKEYFPAAMLMLATEDRWADQLKRKAETMGVADNLIFLGWLDAENMRVAYRACDMCLVPSIYMDPFNRTNIEAMAAKKPVIGTCFGGTPEIVVDGRTGFIVNPLNIEMMANRVLELLKTPEKARGFGEAGYRRVRQLFSPAKVAQDTLGAYRKFL